MKKKLNTEQLEMLETHTRSMFMTELKKTVNKWTSANSPASKPAIQAFGERVATMTADKNTKLGMLYSTCATIMEMREDLAKPRSRKSNVNH